MRSLPNAFLLSSTSLISPKNSISLVRAAYMRPLPFLKLSKSYFSNFLSSTSLSLPFGLNISSPLQIIIPPIPTPIAIAATPIHRFILNAIIV